MYASVCLSVCLSKEVALVLFIFCLYVKIRRFRIRILNKMESAEVQNEAKPTGNLQPYF